MPIDKSVLLKSYDSQRLQFWRQFVSPERHYRDAVDISVEVKGRALVHIAELRALIDEIEADRSR